jgi:hypothetical protein
MPARSGVRLYAGLPSIVGALVACGTSGQARYVVGFRVRHAGAGGEDSSLNTRDFEIDLSSDDATFTPAVAVTGNTADLTTHPIPAQNARYARLHITTAQTATDAPSARIYEFEVFGVGW